MDDKENRENKNEPEHESEIAKMIRAKEGDAAFEPEPEKPPYKPKTFSERWENFWYHHKWTTIIVSVFAVFILIATMQLVTKEKPDIYAIYAGPNYLNSTSNDNIRAALKSVMTDYNGDGEVGLQFMNVTYLNDEQVAEVYALAQEQGVDISFDPESNHDELTRYNMEIFAGESVFCMLDPGLFDTLVDAGGVMTLEEIFDGDVPEDIRAAAVGECGVRLFETEFGQYFGGTFGIEEDTVICLRRVSTMSAFKGQSKTERIHEYHVEMLRSLCEYEKPEE